MKKFILLLLGLFCLAPLQAQESKDDYLRRYSNLVDRVGPDGLGVETLLSKWEAAYPEDPNHMIARFAFCFNRCQHTRLVPMDRDRYLGNAPLLPMTDSTGKKVNYFEVVDYDEALFAEALSAIGKAIATAQNHLDWQMIKVNALLAYEKESPEMALQELKTLVTFHYTSKPDWVHDQLGSVTGEQFEAIMQDYCAALFRINSPASQEAFKALSEHLLTYSKDNPLFLDNLGSYYLVKKDYKKARKYYDQVLKKHPADMTALKNCLLMCRTTKDVKAEKKYLALMAAHGETETDRAGAQARLDAYNRK
jgi:tetratricopeptide (TPR) repeat protein